MEGLVCPGVDPGGLGPSSREFSSRQQRLSRRVNRELSSCSAVDTVTPCVPCRWRVLTKTAFCSSRSSTSSGSVPGLLAAAQPPGCRRRRSSRAKWCQAGLGWAQVVMG